MVQGKLFFLFFSKRTGLAARFLPRKVVRNGRGDVLVHTRGIAIGPSGNIRIVCGESCDTLFVWLKNLLGLMVKGIESRNSVIRARNGWVCIRKENLERRIGSKFVYRECRQDFRSSDLYAARRVL